MVAGVAATESNRKAKCTTLANLDLSAAYGFEAALEANPTLKSQFVADPIGVLKQQTGIDLTGTGYHVHLVDGNNLYSPSESTALSQLNAKAGTNSAWTRIEARTGAGGATPSCVAFCLICLDVGP